MSNEGTKNRIAALMLLTRGQAPSWYHRPDPQPQSNKKKRKKRVNNNNKLSLKTVVCCWIIATCVKVLLFPSYRSTDFLVHRHWKAVTLHLPMSRWYYDDKHVKTIHTLDYPPAFALFESFWSRIWPYFFTVNKECLALIDDRKVLPTITPTCVAFMRSTVIVSDAVWWYASWCISNALQNNNLTLFGILVFHPTLLWLDHVHFQYNGFLLGLLMLSVHYVNQRKDVRAAALIGLVMACKHLYVTCGLWFIAVWIRRYMWERRNLLRLVQIALAGALGIGLPVLIVMDKDDPIRWGKQVLSRLFPFQRGLVHDYWAGNVWAFYMAMGKVVRKVWHTELPQVQPATTGLLMVVMQLPSLYQARDDRTIWSSFAAMAMSTFLVQYHAHEKAILTALLPATVASFTEHNKNIALGSFTAVAITSLFPLLFRVNETSFKISCALLAVASLHWSGKETTWYVGLAMGLTILQLDLLPLPGRFEFLPLAVTSLICGLYYVYWWWQNAVVPCFRYSATKKIS